MSNRGGARRKIERNKRKGARRETSRDSRKIAKNRAILRGVNFIFIIGDCLCARYLLFGIFYRVSSMQPVIIITVLRLYARAFRTFRRTELDCFFSSSSKSFVFLRARFIYEFFASRVYKQT